MDKYIITFRGQNYATNAENLLQAEMKFIYEYEIKPEDEDEIHVTALGEITDDSDIIYF